MAGLWRAVTAACTAILAALLLAVHESKAGGTTDNLEQIFVGRCWEYQRVVNPQAFKQGTKNCTLLYQSFISAFRDKDHCDVRLENYRNFTKAASHPIEINKHMFWIGVFQLVHRYSDLGKRFHTISDTMTGYIVNNLRWCGSTTTGVDMSSCPRYNSCPNEAGFSFWSSASIIYASLARGTAYLMLNGSRPAAFKNDSVFAMYELDNIDPEKVTLLETYVVHDIGKEHQESCGTGSLIELERRVIARGLKFRCTDDPPAVRYLQCVDHSDSPECQGFSSSASSQHATSLCLATLSLLISLFILALL